jgi:hypothetical protein
LSYEAKGSSLLYELVWNPRDCMLRWYLPSLFSCC